MAEAPRIIGARITSGTRFKDKGRLIVQLLLVSLLVVVAWLGWKHFHRSKDLTENPPVAQPSQIEKYQQRSTTQSLKKGDYVTYQITQQDLALTYLTNQDTTSAERIMKEVLSSVPADKIDSGSYMVMASVVEAKGDQTAYKHFLGLVVSRLKAEGKQAEAARYQKALDKL